MASIRLLRESDDRSRFVSGDASLDRYFQVYAGQNQFRHHLSVSYVCEEHGEIKGYASVAGGVLEAESLPAGGPKLPAYPLPILRLARLAVAQSAQGRGIGAQLVRHVLLLALKMASTTGCVGVLVDSKPGALRFYERFGFVKLEVLEGELLAGSVPCFLSVKKIQTALSRS